MVSAGWRTKFCCGTVVFKHNCFSKSSEELFKHLMPRPHPLTPEILISSVWDGTQACSSTSHRSWDWAFLQESNLTHRLTSHPLPKIKGVADFLPQACLLLSPRPSCLISTIPHSAVHPSTGILRAQFTCQALSCIQGNTKVTRQNLTHMDSTAGSEDRRENKHLHGENLETFWMLMERVLNKPQYIVLTSKSLGRVRC